MYLSPVFSLLPTIALCAPCVVLSAVFSFSSFWCPAVSAPKASQSFQLFLKLMLWPVEGELSLHKGTSREFVAQCSAPPLRFFSTSVSSALTSACLTSIDRFRTNLSRIRRVVAAPVCVANSLAKCVVGVCWSSSCSLVFLTHLSCVKVCKTKAASLVRATTRRLSVWWAVTDPWKYAICGLHENASRSIPVPLWLGPWNKWAIAVVCLRGCSAHKEKNKTQCHERQRSCVHGNCLVSANVVGPSFISLVVLHLDGV